MSQQSHNRCLVIIDPQVDFHGGGSLAVPGANDDAVRIANLIAEKDWDCIYVTLDTHQLFDIGHPLYWENPKDGTHPPGFTAITLEEVKQGKWRTSKPEFRQWSEQYLSQLEANAKIKHMVWPEHCIIGSTGFNVQPQIDAALKKWAYKTRRLVTYLFKGTNPHAEMYSCFKAEVEVPGAPETKLNTRVLDDIKNYQQIYCCGQALSHYVRSSVTDMIDYFATPELISRVCLLRDCSNSVGGFEDLGNKWVSDASRRGVQIVSSKDVQ